MLDATGTTEQKPGNASHGHVKPALLHENWKRKTKKINIAKLFRARRGALIDSHEQDQKINESILASVQDPSPEVKGNHTVQNASGAPISCSAFLTEKSLENKCIIIERYCEDSAGLFFNYMYIANCMLGTCPFLIRLGFLLLIVAFLFYLLGDTAEEYFCPTVAKISSLLKLSPSTAGVTFLAFGNGAPDVFSSVLTFTTEGTTGEVGIGALVSAGSFVTAVVVSCVAYAGSKINGEDVRVNKKAFVRDLSFYLGAVVLSFLIYIHGKVCIWHGIALLAYYSIYVATVKFSKEEERLDSYRDLLDMDHHHSVFFQRNSSERSRNLVHNDSLESDPSYKTNMIDWSHRLVQTMGTSCLSSLVYPFHAARQATIPSIEWNEHSKLRLVLSIFFCPLLLLIPLDPILHSQEQVVPLMPSKGIYVPLWSFVAVDSCFLAALVAMLLPNKASDRSSAGHSPQHSNSIHHLDFVHWFSCSCAFLMSILWISGAGADTGICNELIACLSAIGISLGLSPTFLGLTVLAWGNSIGDLFSDVAMAKNGMPTTAIAGCYAGPLFNMAIGLGLSVTVKSIQIFPEKISFIRNTSVVTSYGALAIGLIATLFLVRSAKFKLPPHLRIVLVIIYGLSVVANVVREWGKHFD